MKAVVYHQFGPPEVLQTAEVPKPTPKANQLLVQVHAASVGYGDLTARNFAALNSKTFHMPLPLLFLSRLLFGFGKPKIQVLGSEFSGVVMEAGSKTGRFKPGDEVFGYRGPAMGTHAEYICVPENGAVAPKPDNMTHPQAATVPYGALMASSLLRLAQIQPGGKVLILGASGSIGAAAVQLAKVRGAEVTGVCGGPRMDYVKGLGADFTLDYATQDFSANGERYDLIVDVLGTYGFCHCQHSLKPTGLYLPVSFKSRELVQMMGTSVKARISGGPRVKCALASENADDLNQVRQLIEAGRYTSQVDRVFPMHKAAEAHRYAESGLRRASVVLSMTATDTSAPDGPER